MPVTRVTVTLPAEVVEAIDGRDKNRSHFVLAAVKRELARRQREELRRSLRNPHPESAQLAAEGIAEWAAGLPEEDVGALLEPAAGLPARWIPGKGWVER